MKKRRLKRQWVFVLGIITTLLFQAMVVKAADNYDEYLQQCDVEKGYTCNIFGE